MSAVETKRQVNNPLEEICKEFEIPPVPRLDSSVQIWEGNRMKEELCSLAILDDPGLATRVPLSLLRHAEDKATSPRCAHAKIRPVKEISQVRERYKKKRRSLEANLPVEVLATMSANPDKRAVWSRNGLAPNMENDGWQTPTEENMAWWRWLFNMKRQIKSVGPLLQGENGQILHAMLVMRYRWNNQMIDLQAFELFKTQLDNLIPKGSEEGPLGFGLMAIAKEFSGRNQPSRPL